MGMDIFFAVFIGIAAGTITCALASNLDELDSTDFMYQ